MEGRQELCPQPGLGSSPRKTANIFVHHSDLADEKREYW